MDIKDIFSNNQKWVADKLSKDGSYFEELAKGQSPDFLYIGCSDSRVTAESIMGMEPGDVFVHRNIANVVANDDLNLGSVINYAVNHLGVKNIIVCGHYFCGGVKAAMTTTDLGTLNPWLRNIRDVYRVHQTELDQIADEESRYRRLVELNVQEQCVNLVKNTDVQKALRNDKLSIHGWVFDIQSGKLVDLHIDVKKIAEPIIAIYKVD